MKTIMKVVAIAVLLVISLANGHAQETPPHTTVNMTGILIKPDFDICMDNRITCVILHHDADKKIEATRLVPSTPEVQKQLAKFIGKRTRVTVHGNWGEATECKFVEVVSAEIAHDNVKTRADMK